MGCSVGCRGTSSYEETRTIGLKARAEGYNMIRFNSTKGAGVNYAIFDNTDFSQVLKPIMITPVGK